MIACQNHSNIGIMTLAAKENDQAEDCQTQELTSMPDYVRYSNKKEDKATSKTAECLKLVESEANAAQAKAGLL